MTMNKIFFGALGLALIALGMQLPANAQAVESQAVGSQAIKSQAMESQAIKPQAIESQIIRSQAVKSQAIEPQAVKLQATESQAVEAQTVEGTTALAPTQSAQPAPIEAASWTQPESLSASGLTTEAAVSGQQANTEAAKLTSPASEEATDIAQARRRTRGARVPGSDFIGIGADFGTASDVSFAVISKLTLRDQIAVRPSVIVGNNFAVLVPVTYDFSRFNTDVEGFQIRPYAGVGASYVDNNGSSVGLLLTAGVDVPVARNFTANAQANYAGIFSDSSNFGVTVGVGYNFSGLGR